MKKQKKDPLYKSFGYAFAGIFAVVTKERNMKIHCVANGLCGGSQDSYFILHR